MNEHKGNSDNLIIEFRDAIMQGLDDAHHFPTPQQKQHNACLERPQNTLSPSVSMPHLQNRFMQKTRK
jgi:hypothetical protein